MDEELRGYLVMMDARLNARLDDLAAIEGRVGARLDSLAAMEGRLMARLNNSEERILNRLATMESDAHNTKGFLLNDAVISGRRWLDLEARVTKLEDGQTGTT